MPWFTIASLTPALLLAAAAVFGGVWPLAGVLSITLGVLLADRVRPPAPARHPGEGRHVARGLVVAHFALLALCLWAMTAAHLGLADKALIWLGCGLYVGQVSNSNAHELIHARHRLDRRLGVAVYVSLLNGHHVSAHLRVHHVHAATPEDPNSARLGEGFYRYALRVAAGEFIAGLRADTRHRARAVPPPPGWTHPYVGYVCGAVAALAAAWALASGAGIATLIGLSVYAQAQLMLSDYVQHYGLRRAILPGGKPEPMGPAHSWNAPHWYSGAMMLNAPRHSDHHQNPARSYPTLRLDPATMPMLPRSLPVMAALALVPPLWRRVMDGRAARWQRRGAGGALPDAVPATAPA